MELALFDFDGTITKGDSFLDFIRFTHGSVSFTAGLGRHLHLLVGLKLGLLANQPVKEKVLRHFYGGLEETAFARLGRQYSEQRLGRLLRPAALAKIAEHQNQDHRVVVVSASIRQWLEEWCRQQRIELLCSELEVRDGRLTGRLQGNNCHGPEKVRRLESFLSLADFTAIHAYGDSRGDREMLALASHRHYRPFRHNLTQHT